MNEIDLQQTGTIGILEYPVRWALGLVEFIAKFIALPWELVLHTRIGRRYFSVIGLVGTICLWQFCYGVVLLFSGVSNFISQPIAIGPSLPGMSAPAAGERSTMSFSLDNLLQAVLVLGIFHKFSMQYRKVKGTEPLITTYGGDSRLEPLFSRLGYVGLDRLARNGDHAMKRWIEPACAYAFSRWVVIPWVDPTVGSALCISAMALALRAHLVHLRQQWAIDDVQDTQKIWERQLSEISRRDRGGRLAGEVLPVEIPPYDFP